MAKKVTFVAEYKGQRFTRTASTGRTYTHVTLAEGRDGKPADFRWSMSAKAAQAKLPYGWEARRIATIPCYIEGQEPKVEQAPAAETELCASNSRAKGMHLRVKGQQVSVCGKAQTSRKPNAEQLADNKVCAACTGH